MGDWLGDSGGSSCELAFAYKNSRLVNMVSKCLKIDKSIPLTNQSINTSIKGDLVNQVNQYINPSMARLRSPVGQAGMTHLNGPVHQSAWLLQVRYYIRVHHCISLQVHIISEFYCVSYRFDIISVLHCVSYRCDIISEFHCISTGVILYQSSTVSPTGVMLYQSYTVSPTGVIIISEFHSISYRCDIISEFHCISYRCDIISEFHCISYIVILYQSSTVSPTGVKFISEFHCISYRCESLYQSSTVSPTGVKLYQSSLYLLQV